MVKHNKTSLLTGIKGLCRYFCETEGGGDCQCKNLDWKDYNSTSYNSNIPEVYQFLL